MDTIEKQALAEQAYQKAMQYELDYCPQCVLATVRRNYWRTLGDQREVWPRALTPRS
jgi:hypothetical protein